MKLSSHFVSLQTLHPLLEDGCEGNKKPEPYMKCAFVGISNWALDPAKMNRGIFVQRGTPKSDELGEIARYSLQINFSYRWLITLPLVIKIHTTI